MAGGPGGSPTNVRRTSQEPGVAPNRRCWPSDLEIVSSAPGKSERSADWRASLPLAERLTSLDRPLCESQEPALPRSSAQLGSRHDPPAKHGSYPDDAYRQPAAATRAA